VDWELINGITGIIGAICAMISLGYMVVPHKGSVSGNEFKRIISADRFVFFILASSGWVLCCLSFLWFFEPFGGYPTDREYKQFYGVLLAFPALVILKTGLNYLQGNESDNRTEKDRA